MRNGLSYPLQVMYAKYLLMEAEEEVAEARKLMMSSEKLQSSVAKKKILFNHYSSIIDQYQHDLQRRSHACCNASVLKSFLLEELFHERKRLIELVESDEEFDILHKFEKFINVLEVPTNTTAILPKEFVCEIFQSLSTATLSSGECLVVDGLLTNDIFDHLPVKVKLRKNQHEALIGHEEKMMRKLHHASNRHFITPYGVVRGGGQSAVHGIRLVSSIGEDVSEYVGIVMEKGEEDLATYIDRHPRQLFEVMCILDSLADMLYHAHEIGVILTDFKPSNVMRCFNEKREICWKAIDFDCCRMVGQPIGKQITAEYGAYEAAKHFLNSSSGSASLLASPALDVCSLGWTAWKLLNKNQSLWKKYGLVSDQEIIQKLSIMTKAEIEEQVDLTFMDTLTNALRRCLKQMLEINPAHRIQAVQLKNVLSKVGQKESTINTDTLSQHIDTVGIQVVQRIDELSVHVEALSMEVKAQLVAIGNIIQVETTKAILVGNEKQINSLTAYLEEQRTAAAENRLNIEQVMQEMKRITGGEDNGNNQQVALLSAIADMLRENDATRSIRQDEKLDSLLSMMNELKEEVKEIHHMQSCQLSLLSELNRADNCMPHLFIILPEMKRGKVKNGSVLTKTTNLFNRMKDKILDVLWDRSRLYFLCPVTLKMMPCGPDGKGYSIHVPSALLRTALPIIKMGLLLLKAALATQGLGCCIPNVADMIPATSGIDHAFMQDLFSSFTDKDKTAAEQFCTTIEESVSAGSLRELWKLIAKAEGVTIDETAMMLHWKPSKTGLSLISCKKTGESAWVSKDVEATYKKFGKVSFKDVVVEDSDEE